VAIDAREQPSYLTKDTLYTGEGEEIGRVTDNGDIYALDAKKWITPPSHPGLLGYVDKEGQVKLWAVRTGARA
jgi:hypothetical protein